MFGNHSRLNWGGAQRLIGGKRRIEASLVRLRIPPCCLQLSEVPDAS